MMHWVKLIIITLATYFLVSSNAIAQRVNPFDIIITQNARPAAPSEIKPINDTVDQDNTALIRSDSVISSDTGISVVSDTPLVSSAEIINGTNPFNIKKTSDQLDLNTSSTSLETPVVLDTEVSKVADAGKEKNTSWFSNLKPKLAASKSIDYSLNFIFWILIVSLLILAVVINLKRKSFLNLYRAVTNDNYLKLLQREEYNGSSFFFLLLYFLFFLNASLFLYQLLINKFEIKGYKVFLVLFAALLTIYMVRLIFTFILQLTFPLDKEAKQYNFTVIMFNIIVGLLLIPINILVAYAPFGPKLIYVGLGVIAIFYFLRQIRGLFIAARIKGLSYFHFFIYLCTFEVAPIFWIISFIKNW